MSKTIDEQLLAELDTLWQMALFLEGGDEFCAEGLLAEHLGPAISELATGAGALEDADTFEQVLVCRFFRASPDLPSRRPASVVPSVASGPLDLRVLLDEVGAIPQRARAVIWLMMVRRRSLERTASILGVEQERLRELLEYRDALMGRLVARTAGQVLTPPRASGGECP